MLQVNPPTRGELGVPAGGIRVCRGENAHRPTDMMGWRKAGGQRELEGFSGEPESQVSVRGHLMLVSFVEAGEKGCGIIGGSGL